MSLAPGAAHELLTIEGWSAVAGLPSGSVIHSAAANSPLAVPAPLLFMALATTRRACGATPMAAPPALPPTMVPAVCVPWPLSSMGVGELPTKSCQAAIFPARSGFSAVTPVSMVPTVTPAPSRP